jgi:hypothetical protein
MAVPSTALQPSQKDAHARDRARPMSAHRCGFYDGTERARAKRRGTGSNQTKDIPVWRQSAMKPPLSSTFEGALEHRQRDSPCIVRLSTSLQLRTIGGINPSASKRKSPCCIACTCRTMSLMKREVSRSNEKPGGSREAFLTHGGEDWSDTSSAPAARCCRHAAISDE